MFHCHRLYPRHHSYLLNQADPILVEMSRTQREWSSSCGISVWLLNQLINADGGRINNRAPSVVGDYKQARVVTIEQVKVVVAQIGLKRRKFMSQNP